MGETRARAALLEIALCGEGLRLRVDDGIWLVPRSRRAAALLAFLALAPAHAASRDRLADLLWSERGPDQARGSLRQCLLELRQLCAATPWLDADRTRVALTADRIDIDVHAALDRVRTSAEPEAVAAAVRTLGAAPLADLKAGAEVDSWALEARAAIERDLLHAVFARLARFNADGAAHAARLVADACLALWPDNEEVTVEAMAADLALGEGAAALRRFEALKRTLARDLGCAPGAAATRLRDAATAGRPAPSAPTANPASASADGPPLVFVPAFEVRSGAPHAGLAMALREEILAGLARFRDIRLCSRDGPVDRADMSESEARRAYAVVVTLHGEEADARLIARVTRVSDDAIVWVETLDLARLGAASGVAAVVRRVIATVLPAVADHFFRQLDGRATGPYDAYLIARHRSIHCWRYEDLADAATELERIVARTPDFAPAYAPLARLLNTDYFYSALGTSGPRERHRALELARTAVTLDPQDAHNHAVLGFCHLWHDQPTLARKRFDRVLELNPYNVVRLYEVATGLTYVGALAEARDLLERTNALGIGHSDAFHEDMARLLIAEGEYEGALADIDLVTRPNIQMELYAALAARETGRADAAALIAAWRADVVARWRGVSTPDDAGIAAWVAAHHPFAPALHAPFMAAVERMLGSSAAGQPRGAGPARAGSTSPAAAE